MFKIQAIWSRRCAQGVLRDMCAGRRSQAAMEFLMTYGWVILVVLAAIAALAYFGVLNPAKFFPESCVFHATSGLGCLDFKVTPDSAHLLIINGRGLDMHIQNMSISSCSQTFDRDLPDGHQFLFNLTGCSFGDEGVRIREDIIFYYSYKDSMMMKQSSGSIVARIAD